jgi:thiol-disulfide isomerase/thioredoxin
VVRERIDRGRRRLLEAAAMTIAGARLGAIDIASLTRESRELAAIGRAAEWINSPPLTAASLAGKVVLVQFCTYTCINWLRTLPYVRAWARKYRQELVVIGVHTPEFEFEQNADNVRRTMRQMQVEYPIAIDNDYSIWRAFRNHYWPALYLLDGRGRIRHHHFGEGEYQQSELAVHRLLPASAAVEGFVTVNGTGVEAPADWSNLRSAETYLGFRWTQSLPLRHGWPFSGAWTIGRQAARLGRASGRITYRFHARDLHLVMGPSTPGSTIRYRVTLDGQPPGSARGLDVDEHGNGVATDQRMYQLIRQPGPIADRKFEIEFLDAGIEAFAFTFG